MLTQNWEYVVGFVFLLGLVGCILNTRLPKDPMDPTNFDDSELPDEDPSEDFPGGVGDTYPPKRTYYYRRGDGGWLVYYKEPFGDSFAEANYAEFYREDDAKECVQDKNAAGFDWEILDRIHLASIFAQQHLLEAEYGEHLAKGVQRLIEGAVEKLEQAYQLQGRVITDGKEAVDERC